MSEIAARLGGSKGTLYNYFRSKEELFEAIITDFCQGPAMAIFDAMPPIDASPDIRATLVRVAGGLLAFLLGEPMLKLHRLVVAEAGRFPELGRMFYGDLVRKRGRCASPPTSSRRSPPGWSAMAIRTRWASG